MLERTIHVITRMRFYAVGWDDPEISTQAADGKKKRGRPRKKTKVGKDLRNELQILRDEYNNKVKGLLDELEARHKSKGSKVKDDSKKHIK